MTEKEIASLRDLLEAGQADLVQRLANREVIAVDSSAEMLDQVQHAAERDVAVGTMELESDRLREVRAALNRMDLGLFGICLDCQEEINLKRLAAVPSAPLCIVCRKAAEQGRESSRMAA